MFANYNGKYLELEEVSGEAIQDFKNFDGHGTKKNPEGGRTFFNVRLPEDLARELLEDGWRVKNLDNPDYEPRVQVNFRLDQNEPISRRPKIFMHRGKKWWKLEEDSAPFCVADLMDEEIETCDILVRAYRNPNKFEGTSGWLKEAHFYIRESNMARKYSWMDMAKDSGSVDDFTDDEEIPFSKYEEE